VEFVYWDQEKRSIVKPETRKTCFVRSLHQVQHGEGDLMINRGGIAKKTIIKVSGRQQKEKLATRGHYERSRRGS